jgi:hypothetical protein
MRRIGVEMIPPRKQCPGMVDGQIVEIEPRRPKLGLIRQHLGGPLGRNPDARDHDRKHNKDLAEQQLGWGHGEPLPRRQDAARSGSRSVKGC